MTKTHAPKTLLGDRVLLTPGGCGPDVQCVGFVTKVHSDHVANVLYWCNVDKKWKEETSASFGQKDGGCCYVNPEG
jgi:hypothetical protein